MKAAIKTWRGFWRLSGFERGVVLEAAAALAGIWAGLRLVGFRRTRAALVWLTPRATGHPRGTTPAPSGSARAIARMVAVAARHVFFHTNCLEQSLALWWLLARRGLAADLRIGARKDGGRFEAHAWVECGGAVLNDTGSGEPEFVAFTEDMATLRDRTA